MATDQLTEPLLWTYAQSASALGISERSCWALVASGELPAIRIGIAKRLVRIDRRDVLAFIDRSKTGGRL